MGVPGEGAAGRGGLDLGASLGLDGHVGPNDAGADDGLSDTDITSGLDDLAVRAERPDTVEAGLVLADCVDLEWLA